MSLKSALYALLKLSNDINAIAKGKVGRRIGRRIYGKATGRAARKWFGVLLALTLVGCGGGSLEEYEPSTVIWLEQQWDEMSPGEQTELCAGYDNIGEDAMRETVLQETGDPAEAETYVQFYERHC